MGGLWVTMRTFQYFSSIIWSIFIIYIIFIFQKWLDALKEHIDYTNHYMNQGNVSDEEKEDNMGNIQDSLMVNVFINFLLFIKSNVQCKYFNNVIDFFSAE